MRRDTKRRRRGRATFRRRVSSRLLVQGRAPVQRHLFAREQKGGSDTQWAHTLVVGGVVVCPQLPLVRVPASPLAVSLVNVRGHVSVHGHLLLHCAAFLVADFAVVIGGGGSDSVRRFARVACRRSGREGGYSDAGVSIKRRGMPRRPLRVRACMPGRHDCCAVCSRC